MISTFTAFFDANVFLYMAQTKVFRAQWSQDIHKEWVRNLLKNRPDLDEAALRATVEDMDAAVLDSVVTGYETLIDTLDLPDAGDRHVLAAAIIGKASCIVTFNLAHFPPERLAPYGLHSVHPDDFILDVESLLPSSFARAAAADFSHYQSPPLLVEEYTQSLRKAGVPKTADKVARLSILLKAAAEDGGAPRSG